MDRPPCPQWRHVEVTCINDTQMKGYPVTILKCPQHHMQIAIMGRIERMQRWICFAQSQAISRTIIESYLGSCGDQWVKIQVYVDPAIARRVTDVPIPFTHFPTGSLHLYPRTGIGHEMTHFVSYHTFRGRPQWSFLEEGLAEYFSDPFVRGHHQAIQAAREDGAVEDLVRGATQWIRSDNSDGEGQCLRGSFVGYLLETLGAETFGQLWRRGDAFETALPAVCGWPLTQMLERWVEQLSSDQINLTREPGPLLRDRTVMEAFEPCLACREVAMQRPWENAVSENKS